MIQDTTGKENSCTHDEQTKKDGLPFTSSTGGNASNNITSNAINEKLLEMVGSYTHGLLHAMSQVKTWMIVLIIAVLGSAAWCTWRIENAMSFIEAEAVKQTQYMERADKRNWKISRVIDLSKKRSKDGKLQETLP